MQCTNRSRTKATITQVGHITPAVCPWQCGLSLAQSVSASTCLSIWFWLRSWLCMLCSPLSCAWCIFDIRSVYSVALRVLTFNCTSIFLLIELSTSRCVYRFLRHVPVVYVDYPGRMSLTQIYGTFNRAMLRMVPSLRQYAEQLTDSMVDFYAKSQERFTQDMQPHYIYSPREMTRWVRGIAEALKPLETLSIEGLVRIWAHEGLRLFQDRWVSANGMLISTKVCVGGSV